MPFGSVTPFNIQVEEHSRCNRDKLQSSVWLLDILSSGASLFPGSKKNFIFMSVIIFVYNSGFSSTWVKYWTDIKQKFIPLLLFLPKLRYLLKKLLQLQALTEGEVQAAAPSHSSSLPLTYGVASTVGTIQGTGSISGPSTGAEEPFGKKSKKEKKEKGKENNKLEGTLGRGYQLPQWPNDCWQRTGTNMTTDILKLSSGP